MLTLEGGEEVEGEAEAAAGLEEAVGEAGVGPSSATFGKARAHALPRRRHHA